MKVWEAINILESLDPNAEVTLTIGKAKIKTPETPVSVTPPPYVRDYVIGKEFWPTYNPNTDPLYRNIVTCSDKMH